MLTPPQVYLLRNQIKRYDPRPPEEFITHMAERGIIGIGHWLQIPQISTVYINGNGQRIFEHYLHA